MELLKRIEIERECERLMVQYCHFVDHDEAAKIAGLFIEDGVWKSVDVTMEGRARILQGFQKRQDNKRRMSRHVCNNVLIDVISETEAVGVVYINLYFHDGEEGRPHSTTDCLQKLGEYRDQFVKTDQGWLFARREIFVNFYKDRD
jgi:hypothetical protein